MTEIQTTIKKETIDQLIKINNYKLLNKRTYQEIDIIAAQVAYSIINTDWKNYKNTNPTQSTAYSYALQITKTINNTDTWNHLKKYKNKRLPLPVIFTLLNDIIEQKEKESTRSYNRLIHTPTQYNGERRISTGQVIYSLRASTSSSIHFWSLWVLRTITDQANPETPLHEFAKETIEFRDPCNQIKTQSNISYNKLIGTIKTICNTNIRCQECPFTVIIENEEWCPLRQYKPHLLSKPFSEPDYTLTKDSPLWNK